MDVMSDRPFDERPFQILTIVDRFAGEALSTAPRTNRRACKVVREFDRLRRPRESKAATGSTMAPDSTTE